MAEITSVVAVGARRAICEPIVPAPCTSLRLLEGGYASATGIDTAVKKALNWPDR